MNNSIKMKVVLLCVLCGIKSSSQIIARKVGNNPTTIQATAVLEAESTTKGFLPPRMTTIQRDAISSPTAGLTIYNVTSNCLEWYNGVAWFNGCGNNPVSLTSNGTAIVSAYSCGGAAAGTMTVNTTINGTSVTQVITATVTSVGTYTITAIKNGVTFAAAGTFSGTGAQNITLTASGTPTVAGTNTFTLNTSTNCSFNRTVN